MRTSKRRRRIQGAGTVIIERFRRCVSGSSSCSFCAKVVFPLLFFVEVVQIHLITRRKHVNKTFTETVPVCRIQVIPVAVSVNVLLTCFRRVMRWICTTSTKKSRGKTTLAQNEQDDDPLTHRLNRSMMTVPAPCIRRRRFDVRMRVERPCFRLRQAYGGGSARCCGGGLRCRGEPRTLLLPSGRLPDKGLGASYEPGLRQRRGSCFGLASEAHSTRRGPSRSTAAHKSALLLVWGAGRTVPGG